jgi:hypothetical protein
MSKTKKATKTKAIKKSRFQLISDSANQYGKRSFDNYAQIRSLAEKVKDGLCQYLDSERQCVFLVPPQGPFVSQNYGSAAYSVAGKGFLPLEPISFGLGVRVSESGDFMRIVLHCRKEGDNLYMQVEEDKTFDFELPITKHDLHTCLEGLYQYLLHWFRDRVERYDHGNYGSSDIGFDIQRVDSEA